MKQKAGSLETREGLSEMMELKRNREQGVISGGGGGGALLWARKKEKKLF